MNNICVILRMAFGLIFVVSGFEKLISPHQNFLYVIQGYDLFGSFLEGVIAYIFPWIEFILGVFLVLGLQIKWVLRAFLIITASFVLIVGQALVRSLPLTECGCFGDFISVPPYVILIFDSALLFVIEFLMRKEERTNILSLDRYFMS